uniref:Uncharacterized protein n=1 Tax=Ackermannviridae sp. TaxID=2831612 RepID=A0A8S5VMU6_9CAUD|nr:MAG TPA: hypothetical protein [Ackermannviridae sp.]
MVSPHSQIIFLHFFNISKNLFFYRFSIYECTINF